MAKSFKYLSMASPIVPEAEEVPWWAMSTLSELGTFVDIIAQVDLIWVRL
jgi:hypothetical protein